MTLKELGNAVGVSLVQFQRYETGVSRVAIGRLVAISEVLGVRVDRLIVEPPFNATEPPAGRRRSEDIELARLFKTISDPRHRLAIIALARAIATQGKPPASMSDKFALDVRQGDDDAEVDTKQ
jgi:transcriptional regulator with XRE-family HTH domain